MLELAICLNISNTCNERKFALPQINDIYFTSFEVAKGGLSHIFVFFSIFS